MRIMDWSSDVCSSDLSDWPNCGAGDCVDGNARLYLQPKGALVFEPAAGPAMTADYISDPAEPVPFRARPILPVGYDGRLHWTRSLPNAQRDAPRRTDVLPFTAPR